ncbi:MAG: sugar ABC transporter substrate-binding protein [Pseudonocardiales bacterium]
MGRIRMAMVAAGAGLMLTACGASSSGADPKVGVILPETATSARYESFDKPLLDKALRAEGLDPDIQNAQGDVQKFITLADGMINSGVRVLVIDAPNSEVGSAVARKAQAAGIPTIDYDRLNLGGSSDYYVGFDAVRVGALQAEGLMRGVGDKPGANIIEIQGAPTDHNATLLHQGQQSVLKPRYDSGAYQLVGSQRILGWDNQLGGVTFEQLLTANGGKVDGVIAANDGMAAAVITVLRKAGLVGKVAVTGQDATPEALQAILRGDQYMTVFKLIADEANATAKLAAALARGDRTSADALATVTVTDPTANRTVKSVLLTPILITKDNVKQVVDAGAVRASEICVADTATVCGQLGLVSTP